MTTLNILAINPGATSTKIGYFSDDRLVYRQTITHPLAELMAFPKIQDQLEFRYESILTSLHKAKIDLRQIDGIAARGGLLPPVKAGAYEVNQEMLDYLKERPRVEHASNLGAMLAAKLKEHCSERTRAFIYDSVTVDEFPAIARISGLKGLKRESIGHALNMRAVVKEVARQEGRKYDEITMIVAHLGGGNSVSLHHHGRMIELISDDEGPFSTERTGGLPIKQVIELCYQHSKSEMMALYRKKGGLLSYLGTNDGRIIEDKINSGDSEAKLIYEAFSYQVAKAIGSLAPIVNGEIDGIIITGGLAYSQFLRTDFKNKLAFLGPIYFIPGERELEALAAGVGRVLLGKEKEHRFKL
ncbi:butyrate kinase [Vagococcus salmoninarum]|uniref:butyrate kinase n=1 Tax=Vagococcus salmoninarum TaxID=2739 RepID=UPI0018816A47|nr:butyrate kinase [Vagococcus salmoninarum]MBE9388342.1 butyrate kinase [Vagococcus salmoninarum]